MSKIIFSSIFAGFTLHLVSSASVVCCFALIPGQALADSKINPSDAQFDQRLPPVLPGEEVSDGKKTMKLWSTSGPVPVIQPTQPSYGGAGEWGVPGSVIIDGRSSLPTSPGAIDNYPANNGSISNGSQRPPEKRY